MKLHRLELTGFGPFRDTQVVDFDAFDADGLFLISGRTGTGKSSILDGVSFALYGSVPRYDGGEKRLRSDHAGLTDPTEVRLEFTVGERRWRVTRAPEYDRPAKRGGGLTTEPPRAELEEQVEGRWVGRAAKPRTVGEALGEILGLNAQQFQQVILLAQNKFSRFLLASGEERQGLLRTLFGTRRFEQYRDELDRRRREAEAALAAVVSRAGTLVEEGERLARAHDLDTAEAHDDSGALGTADAPGTNPDATRADQATVATRREDLARAYQRARYRVEQSELARTAAEEHFATATAAHAAVVAAAERARERQALRDRLIELEGRAEEIGRARRRLDDARAAAVLRAPLDTLERAERAALAAADEAAAARDRWRAGGADVSIDAAHAVEQLTGDLARWEIAAAQERDLVARRVEHETAVATIATLQDDLAEIDARRAARPAERAEIDAEIADLSMRATRLEDLRAEHVRLRESVAAARRAADLSAALTAAEAAYAAAVADSEAASSALGALLRRRVAGVAGELAASLVPGELCPVCGSVDHPHPSPPADDPVTDELLAAAERARDDASAADVDARERAALARDALAEARIAAGGLDSATAEHRLAAAAVAQSEAERAAAALALLSQRRAAADQAAAADDERRAACVEQLAITRERARAAESDISRLEEVVTAALGSFSTVAARIAAVAAERDRARAVVAADAARDERARAHRDARHELDARLAASGFDDLDAARAALISEDEIEAIDIVIADHAAQLSATRSRLFELELDAGGDDASDGDVDASRQTVEIADIARTETISAHAGAVRTAEALDDLLQQVDQALAAVQESADETAGVIRLADSVAGRAPNTMRMDLETFVLAAELEEIVAAANVRLAEMSSGRYTLHHSDARAARGRASGLGIDVLDAHTGRLRPPQSLSGGETFLASLALALGLGEVVTARAGGIRLDTLFVDEGFGSLDPETLELALRTLDDLRTGGRTVGVISHVEAMKEQLPAQLRVASTPEGPSIIRQDAARALVVDRAR
ncbi:exonuclease SbcC [Microbacterium sp. AG790]|uniref:AAA family ATPase n=1 Tax=Microbacterium sp. AG790 TaxID=2183995 RepID=UPI000EB3C47E|nr:SMC family ATPase [Microbacterium sp. AG790]RKS93126.1 exonuclease SbcC [Microbacterium sp. AG790]